MILASLAGLLWYNLRELDQAAARTANIGSASAFVLKLNGVITPSSAGALLAISDGLFARRGLSVEISAGKNDEDVASAVAVNQNVIGVASAQGFLKARADGFPIVAFAASYVASSVQFFALSDTKFVEPIDLEGKRIGYRPGVEISSILSAFIAKNAIAQSGLKLVQTETPTFDLLHGNIDVLIGHQEVEGEILWSSNVSYRTVSPDSFGVHTMGPVYIANEKAFSSPDRLEDFLIAVADGWNAAYSDYDRSVPIIAGIIEEKVSPAVLSRVMDAQRRLLRPSGTRLGEIDSQRLKNLHELLLQQRLMRQPIDLSRAVNYDVLRGVYRSKPDTPLRDLNSKS
ncbi:ABC transporter substrate-binding protein [Bradyrhizobium sp. SSUT112]|uniref:ABC transporter substrate-binding protein n=1 Tax=Bradyrhizobium sp. SSUT112 TaxID=3040604 RepID=UPI00244B1CB1|nr:ABC transporter substrate-binding protein [Bradyrhizobium sp. SSUT112]MDH2356824.1 ABC transporter substrate-binding protein [Bradyrhizobium sp. SSUT112]